MKFLYSKEASAREILVENENFLHLRARRLKVGQRLDFANLNDEFLYTYKCILSEKKSFLFEYESKRQSEAFKSELELALAVIEPKNIEKALPFLNELGVKKLHFVYADFSQKNFRLDFERLNRILIQSCQQCGRTNLMEFELFNDSDSFYKAHQNAILLDFEGKEFANFYPYEKALIFVGAEGGFSQRERELFKEKIAFAHKQILRAEHALCALATKILL